MNDVSEDQEAAGEAHTQSKNIYKRNELVFY
jgi:hypothetical protein